MKSAVFCLVGLMLGLILGWWLGLTIHASKVQDAAQAAADEAAGAFGTAQAERLLELEQHLAAKEAALAAVESELELYRVQAGERGQVKPDDEVVANEAPANPFMANVQAIAAETSRARRQEEIDKLKWSLNLTPEQIAALETYYEEESAAEAKMMEQMFSGKSMEALQQDAIEAAGDKAYHTVSQLLKDILTPEQLAAYEVNQEEEALERKEANAYRELSTMQSQFLLDDEQKDTVFAIFYEKEYAMKPEEWDAHDLDGQDPDFYIKSRSVENERLLEELSDVLTPEQVELYRKKLENETEMIRKSMQMFAPPSKP